MIILERPIAGYNNILLSANKNMSFGVNAKVNYVGVKKEEPKKVHQQDTPSSHLETLDSDTSTSKKITTTGHLETLEHTNNKVAIVPNKDNEQILTFGVLAVSTYLTAKYVL